MIQRPPSLLGQYAGFITRAIAFLIDILFVTTTITLSGAAISAFINFFNVDSLTAMLFQNAALIDQILRVVLGFAAVLFVVLYFVVLWVFTSGYTIGKWIMGVRIVRLDGKRLTALRAFLRYGAMWLSALVFFVGFLWVLGDNRRQAWHDKAARTCVIYSWDAREDTGMLEGIRKRLDYLAKTRARMKEETRQLTHHNSTQAAAPAVEAPQTAVSPADEPAETTAPG